MLETIELRWFFKGSLSQNAFADNYLTTPNNYELRSDYYFIIRNCDYLGVKIREKRLEIK
jgi:hypothetical protein